jgi:hypothetical protein
VFREVVQIRFFMASDNGRREFEMPVFTGLGELFSDGKSQGRGRYRVEETNRPGSVLRRIEGTIDLDQMQLYKLIAANASLTLHLEDGQRWDCCLQNDQGRLVNRGGELYKA